jgi:hypothetical protein
MDPARPGVNSDGDSADSPNDRRIASHSDYVAASSRSYRPRDGQCRRRTHKRRGRWEGGSHGDYGFSKNAVLGYDVWGRVPAFESQAESGACRSLPKQVNYSFQSLRAMLINIRFQRLHSFYQVCFRPTTVLDSLWSRRMGLAWL